MDWTRKMHVNKNTRYSNIQIITVHSQLVQYRGLPSAGVISAVNTFYKLLNQFSYITKFRS